MQMKLTLLRRNSDDEIVELNNLIKEQNLPGIIATIERKEAEPNSMGTAEFLPVISLILDSSLISTSIEIIYNELKEYFTKRKQQPKEELSLSKALMEVNIETKSGTKLSMKINSFDENERIQFFTIVSKVIEQ